MRKVVLVSLIAIFVAGGVWFFCLRGHDAPGIEGPALSVRFLDEGLTGAVLVRTPEGRVAVIDPTSRRTAALADLLAGEQVREISVVACDPSYDSADAIAKLQGSLKVQRVVSVQQADGAERWKSMLLRARSKPVAQTLIAPGGSVKLSPTVSMDVLRCLPETARDDGSCIIRIVYRGKSVFYVSQLHPQGEAGLIASGVDLQSSVLAVGKRAWRDNPSMELLSKVRPEVCVLCSSRPSSSVIGRLRPENSGATLFRTAKDGIIEIVTDGRSVQFTAGGRP